MSETKKLSIISMSGDFDKVIAVFTLASGAAAVGYEVTIFFTFWGLNAIKKKPVVVLSATAFWPASSTFCWGGERTCRSAD